MQDATGPPPGVQSGEPSTGEKSHPVEKNTCLEEGGSKKEREEAMQKQEAPRRTGTSLSAAAEETRNTAKGVGSEEEKNDKGRNEGSKGGGDGSAAAEGGAARGTGTGGRGGPRKRDDDDDNWVRDSKCYSGAVGSSEEVLSSLALGKAPSVNIVVMTGDQLLEAEEAVKGITGLQAFEVALPQTEDEEAPIGATSKLQVFVGKGPKLTRCKQLGGSIFGDRQKGEKESKGANADDTPKHKFVVRAYAATSLADSTTTIKAYVPRLNMADAKWKKPIDNPNAALAELWASETGLRLRGTGWRQTRGGDKDMIFGCARVKPGLEERVASYSGRKGVYLGVHGQDAASRQAVSWCKRNEDEQKD